MGNNNIKKCVSCGLNTGYSINGHVEVNGQLCSECFIDVYKKVHKKDVYTDKKS